MSLISSVLLSAVLAGGAASTPLAGTSWVLTSYGQQGQEQKPSVQPLTLTFAGRSASGNAGCNTFTAGYTVGGPTLKFSRLGLARMLCGAEQMKQEAAYSALLGKVSRYQLRQGQLTLWTKTGERLTFAAKTGETMTANPAPWNGTWNITALHLGQKTIQLPKDSRLDLQLSAKGVTLQGQAGCNQISGVGQQKGQLLQFERLTTTRMMCQNMDAERAVLELLRQPVTVEQKGEAMIWQNARGSLTLSRQSAGPGLTLGTLEGRTFSLASVNGQAVQLPKPITISFRPDRVEGSDGCNHYFSSATLQDGRLKVGLLASTLAACPEYDQLPNIASLLQTTPRIQATDSTLTLESGAETWVFKAE